MPAWKEWLSQYGREVRNASFGDSAASPDEGSEETELYIDGDVTDQLLRRSVTWSSSIFKSLPHLRLLMTQMMVQEERKMLYLFDALSRNSPCYAVLLPHYQASPPSSAPPPQPWIPKHLPNRLADSMATVPSASTEALNVTQHDAASADSQDEAPADFSYIDGALTWESTKILDEDVITVINTLGGTAEYTIFSLEAVSGEGDAAKKAPFKLRTTNAMILPQDYLDRFLFTSLPAFLQDKKVSVLISTLSGTGLAQAFFDDVLHPLLRAIGFEDSKYTVAKTKSTDSVKEFAQFSLIDDANEGKEHTVLMLSGDGGIVDIINAMLQGKERSRYDTLLRGRMSLIE